jgi:hypothetical protein
MAAAIALFLFGGMTAMLSLQLPIGNLRVPGSGFFPFALGMVLMALAAAQAMQVRLTQPLAAAEPKAASGDATRQVVLFMLAVALATALLKPIGYAPVCFLLMLALLRILGMRQWHVAGPIALLSAAAAHVVFVTWLQIPLPLAGRFGF